MHNNDTWHLYEAFHLQSALCTLENSLSQGKYCYFYCTARETERDKSSLGIIRNEL